MSGKFVGQTNSFAAFMKMKNVRRITKTIPNVKHQKDLFYSTSKDKFNPHKIF